MELKPCPCCGRTPYKKEKWYHINHKRNCLFDGMIESINEDDVDLIEAWNTPAIEGDAGNDA